MKHPTIFLPCAALVAALILGGCSAASRDPSSGYREALAARPGVVFANAADGRRAVERFDALYADLGEKNVAARVRQTYAPEAWFNDTIATEVGIDAIESYLLKTARGAEFVK
ncbi:MAG: hypothetical protein RIR25_27, partial [Verrucomicrobiota bacterium]